MVKGNSKEEVRVAGEEALLMIYGSSKGENLNELHREVFKMKVNSYLEQ
jgi:hypothetical protein